MFPKLNSRAEQQEKGDSWFHSPEFDSKYRRRRAQQRTWFKHKAKEATADPDDFQPSVVAARRRFFDQMQGKKPRRGDPARVADRK